MKVIVLVSLIFLLFLINTVASIENNMYVTIPKDKSFYCMYLSLPDDIGLQVIQKNSKISIKANDDSWFITKYVNLNLNKGVKTKIPFCVKYTDKSEGDFSLYRIEISSDDLGIKKKISGHKQQATQMA